MTIEFQDLPHYYPLTVQIKTNKACSLKPIQGEWLINPTLDLVSDSPMTAGEVVLQVADTLKKTFVRFAPRYNTGGFEASIPDFDAIVHALKLLGESELNEEELPDGFYKPTWTISTYKGRENYWFEKIDIQFFGVGFIIRRHFKLDIRLDTLHLKCNAPGGTVRYWDFNKRVWETSFYIDQGIEVVRHVKNQGLILPGSSSNQSKCSIYEVATLVACYVARPDYLPDHFIHDSAGKIVIVSGKEKLLSFPKIHQFGHIETHVTKNIVLGLMSEYQDVEFDNYEFSWFVAPSEEDFSNNTPAAIVL